MLDSLLGYMSICNTAQGTPYKGYKFVNPQKVRYKHFRNFLSVTLQLEELLKLFNCLKKY